MILEVSPKLRFILKEGRAFLKTSHQLLLLKPKRYEVSAYYVVFISRMVDGEYKSLQDIVDACNNKIEIIQVEESNYAEYFDSNTSNL